MFGKSIFGTSLGDTAPQTNTPTTAQPLRTPEAEIRQRASQLQPPMTAAEVALLVANSQLAQTRATQQTVSNLVEQAWRLRAVSQPLTTPAAAETAYNNRRLTVLRTIETLSPTNDPVLPALRRWFDQTYPERRGTSTPATQVTPVGPTQTAMTQLLVPMSWQQKLAISSVAGGAVGYMTAKVTGSKHPIAYAGAGAVAVPVVLVALLMRAFSHPY